MEAKARILRTEKTLEKMVRSKGLEPSRLLGTTTSRLRVYQFHHERIAGRGTWPKHRPIDKPFLPPPCSLIM